MESQNTVRLENLMDQIDQLVFKLTERYFKEANEWWSTLYN